MDVSEYALVDVGLLDPFAQLTVNVIALRTLAKFEA
jgi:hypothetical protein